MDWLTFGLLLETSRLDLCGMEAGITLGLSRTETAHPQSLQRWVFSVPTGSLCVPAPSGVPRCCLHLFCRWRWLGGVFASLVLGPCRTRQTSSGITWQEGKVSSELHWKKQALLFGKRVATTVNHRKEGRKHEVCNECDTRH